MSRFIAAQVVAIALVMGVPAGSHEQASQLLDRYATTGETGPATFRNADQFLDLLNSQGKKWASSAGAGEEDRRHHLLALLVLETAAQVDVSEGMKVIEWACELLRDEPPDEFERQWLIASSSVFLRAYMEAQYRLSEVPGSVHRGTKATAHLDHALGRYPNESRLRLAKVLTRPESYALTSTPGVDPGKLVSIPVYVIKPVVMPKPLDRLNATVTELEALSVDREVGSEAQAHLGLLSFHLGNVAEAIEHFRFAADAAQDPFVSNLAWLGLGLSFDAGGRRNEATNAYERAASAMPRARASAVQLAAHLFLAGERARASEIVERAFGPNALDLEPWRHILAPDRHVPADIRKLRALLGLPRYSQDEIPGRDSLTGTEGAASPVAPEQRSFDPRFHSMATGVVVDALISARNVPVAGLTEADLEVTDRGQRQTFELAEVEHSPLDVSLVVDMFNEFIIGVYGRGRSEVSPAVTDRLRQDVGSIAARLRSGDRLRVLQVDGQVGAELWPMQSAPFPLDRLPRGTGLAGAIGETAKPQATYGRLQALFDPVAAALMKSVPVDRRHLVVVVTDGIDAASVLPPTLFSELARESWSVMYVLRRDTQEELAVKFGARLPTWAYGYLYWKPNPRVIEDAALATGGAVLYHGGGTLLPDFSRALDQFRRGYVIRYRPTDTTAGWHDIRIRVLRPGNYEIKSRKGYTAR